MSTVSSATSTTSATSATSAASATSATMRKVVDVESKQSRKEGWWVYFVFEDDSLPAFGVHYGLQRFVIWWCQVSGTVYVLTTSDHLWFSLDTFDGVTHCPGVAFKLGALPLADTERQCNRVGTYGSYELYVVEQHAGAEQHTIRPPVFAQSRAKCIATAGVFRDSGGDRFCVNQVWTELPPVSALAPAKLRLRLLDSHDGCALVVAYDGHNFDHRGVFRYRVDTAQWEVASIGEAPIKTERNNAHDALVTAQQRDDKWVLVFYDISTHTFSSQTVKGAENVRVLAVTPGDTYCGRALFTDDSIHKVSFMWDGTMSWPGAWDLF